MTHTKDNNVITNMLIYIYIFETNSVNFETEFFDMSKIWFYSRILKNLIAKVKGSIFRFE